MHVTIDRDCAVPIYLQIAQQIRQSILDGDPPTGARLPPERRLAKLLGVNRTTVVNAYRELAADGLVSGQVGRGTIVIHGAPEPEASPAGPGGWPRLDANGDRTTGYSGEPGRSRATPIPWAQLFTATTDVMDDPLLRDAMTVSARPDVIRLATGIPSPELYPIDDIRAIFDEALGNAGQTLLQHTPTEGYPPLRDELARWMERAAAAAGVPSAVDPNHIVVVAGSLRYGDRGLEGEPWAAVSQDGGATWRAEIPVNGFGDGRCTTVVAIGPAAAILTVSECSGNPIPRWRGTTTC